MHESESIYIHNKNLLKEFHVHSYTHIKIRLQDFSALKSEEYFISQTKRPVSNLYISTLLQYSAPV